MSGNKSAPDRPTVLLTTTLHLDKTARLAMAFADVDCDVLVLCPAGHWAKKLQCVRQCLHYSALRPLRSLQKVIEDAAPDLIIPCDDRAVRHTHVLHEMTANPEVRARLGRSLGAPEMFAVTEGRHDLMALARRHGIPVPDTMVINSVSDLLAWHQEHPLPWVLKSDGSWAGMGVRIVTSQNEAAQAFEDMSSPAKASTAINQALLEWDFFWVRPWFRAERGVISVQQYIGGNAANCALACWEGEVLAAVAVEVVVTRSNNGPASVVRIVEGNEMIEAARRVAKACGITGLVGFDFVLEARTGKPFMIEMNPRAVPLCHIPLGPGRDLVQALLERSTGASRRPRIPATRQDFIIYFPGLSAEYPGSPLLAEGYHDVPWQEPEMVRALLKPEPKRRTWLQRNIRRLRGLARHQRFGDRPSEGPIAQH
jgi:hypothetical protein